MVPRRWRRRWASGGLAALVLSALACGPAEPPRLDLERALAQREENRPPLIEGLRLLPARPLPGAPVTARLDAHDPDGDPLVLDFEWRLDGRRYGHGEPTLTLPEGSKGALLELRVSARDRRHRSQPLRVAARIGNRPPEMLDLVIEPARDITVADELRVSSRAMDPDGDALTLRYRWRIDGQTLAETGPVLDRRHFSRGDVIELEVSASDGEDESEPLHSPPIAVVNSVPVIVSEPTAPDASGAFRYRVRADDADGDRRLRFRLVSAPAGMSIDWLNGRVTWLPGEEQAGVHGIEIEVDDLAGGTARQRFDVDVGFESVPALPAAPAR